MAEDRFNPLDNPEEAGRVAQASRPAPRQAVPQDPDAEFEEFVSESLRQRLNIREAPGRPGTEPETESDEDFDETTLREEDPTSEGAQPATPSAPSMPQAPEGGTAPAPAAVSPEPRYAYNGQYYTLQELATQGLLSEALQKAQQADQQRGAAPRQEPQALPQMTPQQMQQTVAPMVQQLVESGWLEEDVAALYPMTVTSMVQLHARLLQAERLLGTLAQERQVHQQQQTAQEAMQALEAAMTAAAQAGPLYAPLQEPETREGFKKYLINDVNPMLAQLTPEFIQRQWFAYNQEVVLQLHQQAQAAQQPRPVRPASSGAPGRSARVRVPVESQDEEWADLLDRL